MKKLLYSSTLVLALSLAACGSETDLEEKTSDTTESSETTITKENVLETSSELDTVESLEKPDEVITYVEETRDAYLALAELNSRWEELRNASANGEITDYDFGVAIVNEIIPLNTDLVERVESIVPPTDETIETSELLISAVNKQHQAFTEVIAAIDTGDASKITSANNILSEVRTIDRDFSRKMETLVEKYGIN